MNECESVKLSKMLAWQCSSEFIFRQYGFQFAQFDNFNSSHIFSAFNFCFCQILRLKQEASKTRKWRDYHYNDDHDHDDRIAPKAPVSGGKLTTDLHNFTSFLFFHFQEWTFRREKQSVWASHRDRRAFVHLWRQQHVQGCAVGNRTCRWPKQNLRWTGVCWHLCLPLLSPGPSRSGVRFVQGLWLWKRLYKLYRAERQVSEELRQKDRHFWVLLELPFDSPRLSQWNSWPCLRWDGLQTGNKHWLCDHVKLWHLQAHGRVNSNFCSRSGSQVLASCDLNMYNTLHTAFLSIVASMLNTTTSLKTTRNVSTKVFSWMNSIMQQTTVRCPKVWHRHDSNFWVQFYLPGNAGNKDKFSPCSLMSMKEKLDALGNELGEDDCFKDLLYEDGESNIEISLCGNGIVEPGEQCDCGYDQESCNDFCCYPANIDATQRYWNSTAKYCSRNERSACLTRPGLIYGFYVPWAVIACFVLITSFLLYKDWHGERKLFTHITKHRVRIIN